MHDMVDLVTSEPPPLRHSVDEIVRQGERVQRRRRAGWAASGAAAVAVLGVTAAVAIASSTGTTPAVVAASPAATDEAPLAPLVAFPNPAPPFAFTFAGYRVGGLRVADPIDVSTAYQIAPVYDDTLPTNDKPLSPSEAAEAARNHKASPSLYAYLTVFRPGAYDPSKLSNPQQVSIGGRPGLQVLSPGFGGLTTLAWQYDPGTPTAWAVLTASSSDAKHPSPTELQKLAAGLRGSTPKPAKLPVKLTYVPAGYRANEVAVHAMAGLNGIAAAREGDYAGIMFSNPALPTTGLTEPYGGVDGNDPPGSFQLFVVPSQNSNQTASPGITCLNGFCNRWSAGVNLQVASGGRLSNTEMTKILNGIQLANVHDESTWTAATVAIP